MAAADRVAGDHRHDRLGQAADLDVQVGDVEAPDRRRPRACSRCRRARAGRRPSRTRAGPRRSRTITPTDGVLARALERVGELDDRLRPERVAHLRAVDRDLRDAVAAQLVADVLVLAGGRPAARSRRGDISLSRGMDSAIGSPAPPGAAPSASRSRRRRDGDLPRAAAARGARRGRRCTCAARARGEPVALAARARAAVRRGAARLPAARRARGAGRPAAAPSASAQAVLREVEVRVERPMTRRRRRVPAARPGRARRRRARRPHLGHDRRARSRSSSPTATSAPTRAGSRRRWASATTSAGCARCRSRTSAA